MGNSKLNPFVNALVITLLVVSNFKANGQITTACSSSMMSSFTPCLNYVTGSTANGGSPTADCCNSVKSIMTGSVDCACLIITGNVPFSIPFSRPLAISLPKICNIGVPIRCQASGVPLPPPGPVLFGPTQAPTPAAASPIGQRASKITADASPPFEASSPDEISPAASPPFEASPDQITPEASPPEVVSLGPVANPGIRPVLNPNSASNPSHVSPPLLVLTVLGLMVFKW